MRLKVNGSWKVAYCLEPDTATHAGVDYGDGSNTGVSGDWRVNLTGNQQRAIGLTMLYSAQHHPIPCPPPKVWVGGCHPDYHLGKSSWACVIPQPYACTDSGLINQFDNASKGVRYNDTEAIITSKGIRAKYNTLSSEMALHGVIPSFTGATRSIAPYSCHAASSQRQLHPHPHRHQWGTGQLSILLAISSDPEPKQQYLDCYRRVRGLLGYADLQRFQDNDQPGESRLFVPDFLPG